MNRTTVIVVLFFLSLGLVGCNSATTESYSIFANNKLKDTITVWLTKAGPPYGKGLAPPEDEAIGTSVIIPPQAVKVDPGDSAGLREIKIDIEPGNWAVLRVYVATDFNEILSLSRGSPDRVDFHLEPGVTDIDIIRKDGELAAIPHVRSATRPTTRPTP